MKVPKIFGAGLLSSVGEARNCLDAKVRKIPLSWRCIEYDYDITTQQPQLFVTPHFAHLSEVLEEVAKKMAFRKGGLEGLQKILKAQSVNTVQWNSGLQISGQLKEIISPSSPKTNPTSLQEALGYLQFTGPCQLSYEDEELEGHGTQTHSEGYGTPLGFLKSFPEQCPSSFSLAQWQTLGAKENQKIQWEFVSGLRVQGVFRQLLQKKANHGKGQAKSLILSLDRAKVSLGDRVLFQPEWGVYDMALGSEIPSVFGGPAHREKYGELKDFKVAQIPKASYSDKQLQLHDIYTSIRKLREEKTRGPSLKKAIHALQQTLDRDFSKDWLSRLEIYELAFYLEEEKEKIQKPLQEQFHLLSQESAEKKSLIEDGLRYAGME